jgi:prepilin-type N-terminal cleavage/methylation domain-containing protein
MANRPNGFTLIEILVALLILTVVATIAIPNFRRFNSDQEIVNTTSDVIRLLQQAQSSAQSQIACQNTLPTGNQPVTFWEFMLQSNKTYRLQVECVDDTGAALPVNPYPTTTLQNVTIAATYNDTLGGSGSCSNAAIRFNANSPTLNLNGGTPSIPGRVVDVICNGGASTPINQVTLTITQSGFPPQIVTVEGNGTVHQ